jgi:hypothetical protein
VQVTENFQEAVDLAGSVACKPQLGSDSGSVLVLTRHELVAMLATHEAGNCQEMPQPGTVRLVLAVVREDKEKSLSD